MNNQELDAVFEKCIRPATFPVAIKILQSREIPAGYRQPTKTFGYRINICQGVNIARRYGWRFAFLAEDFACPLSVLIFGFADNPDFVDEGKIIYPDFTDSLEAAVKTQAMQPRVPTGSISGVLIGPLGKVDFEPDIVLVYGNPAQIVRMVQGALYHHGGAIESRFSGRCACAQSFIYPYLHKKCNVVIPAQGERLYAMTCDDELVFAIPSEEMTNVADGLEHTHKRGVSRMPTPFFGLRTKPEFPERYQQLEEFLGLDGK